MAKGSGGAGRGTGRPGGAVGGDTAVLSKQLAAARQQYAALNNELVAVGDRGRISGQIIGGTVGPQNIAAYNRTQAGRNQLRSEDGIMREAQRVQNRISSLEKRLQTAQAGGRAVEKLSRALDNYKNPPRGYEVIARDSYRRAYNAAKKKGVNLRGFPKP